MQNKTLIFLSITTVILVIAVAWLAWRINSIDSLLHRPVTIPQENIAPNSNPYNAPSATDPAENGLISEKIETGRFVIITDNGFLTKTFEVNADSKLNLSISNQGQNTHSFNIDKLNIKTGPINTEQTTKVTATLPEGITSLEYYSDSGNDADTNTFKGTIKIIEK